MRRTRVVIELYCRDSSRLDFLVNTFFSKNVPPSTGAVGFGQASIRLSKCWILVSGDAEVIRSAQKIISIPQIQQVTSPEIRVPSFRFDQRISCDSELFLRTQSRANLTRNIQSDFGLKGNQVFEVAL